MNTTNLAFYIAMSVVSALAVYALLLAKYGVDSNEIDE